MSRPRHGLTFAAVERNGFEVRWQIDGEALGAAQLDAIGPRTLVVAYHTADADLVVGYALDRGAELWRRGGDRSFTRVHRLWADGERGYMVSDRGLSAFDLVTGDRVWGEVPVGPGCAVTVGDDMLAVEDGATQRLFAPATGVQVGALKIGDTKACRGDRTVHPETVASPVIAHGRIFAFDPVVGRGKPTLRAVDLATGAELWRRRDFRGTVLHALHDEVYVNSRDENTLVALDATTGETRTKISIGSSFHVGVVPGGGAAGPLVVVHSQGTGTWYLGRAAEPVPLEKWTIRGRLMRPSLVYDRGPIPLAGFAVRVFDREVVTDAHGRFKASGRALGLVWIEPGRNRRPAHSGGLWWDFWPFFLELDGSGEYAYEAIVADANYVD